MTANPTRAKDKPLDFMVAVEIITTSVAGRGHHGQPGIYINPFGTRQEKLRTFFNTQVNRYLLMG
jgi:hypothetical protein